MTHPHNSPRGLFVKDRVYVNERMEICDRDFYANSTGYIFEAETAKPTTDNGVAITFVTNSTGVALLINSTGTTWKYLLTTSVQPT